MGDVIHKTRKKERKKKGRLDEAAEGKGREFISTLPW